MRAKCGNATWHAEVAEKTALMMAPQGGSEAQSTAAFMLLRGRYAWLGRGWGGGDVWPYPDELRMLEPGEPQGICKVLGENGEEEEEGGTSFRRSYSHMDVTLHCANWSAIFEDSDSVQGPRNQTAS
eukprot:SAG22_NODE_400_length_11089_cov_6.934668_6_plen_127_part_00